MVDEKKLKVSYELLEGQMHDRLKREITILEERLKPKIKKRLKESTIQSKLLGKVDSEDFKKQVERLDNVVQVLQDKVEYRLPAMDYEFKRTLKVKADKVWVEELQTKKADIAIIDQLIERMNKFEELL